MIETVAVPPFPDRADDAHKGQVGRVLVVGGRFDEVGMIGAVALAADAAMRIGAGLVQVYAPREVCLAVHVLCPAVTTRVMDRPGAQSPADVAADFRADVIAIGPGLSPRISGQAVLEACESFGGPVVVDADGLNALARVGRWRVGGGGRVVLTPHVGELSRMCDGLGLAVDESDRVSAASELARATNTITVLKGKGTVVSDGRRYFVNQTGNSGMATAGSGDVLTGMVAALIGQGLGPFESAVLGVHLHGRSGDFAAERKGLISLTASDMVESIFEAVVAHRRG